MHKINPSLAVLKFGGAALSTTERIAAAARLVAKAAGRYPQLVVVVSAMGKTTDHLLTLVDSLVKSRMAGDASIDLILAAGEQIAAGLMAVALQAEGLTARPFLGSQVRIITDDIAGAATVKKVERARLSEALLRGEIPVVAGFQGVGSHGQITTLGRGGSDTTAVAVAAALGAAVCEFYKDVDGVYSEDPARAPSATKFATLSYDSMLALSKSGARVLSASAVTLAKNHSVNLVVRSAFTDALGTTVSTPSPSTGGPNP